MILDLLTVGFKGVLKVILSNKQCRSNMNLTINVNITLHKITLDVCIYTCSNIVYSPKYVQINDLDAAADQL
mgnify:CR=1 FL=1